MFFNRCASASSLLLFLYVTVTIVVVGTQKVRVQRCYTCDVRDNGQECADPLTFDLEESEEKGLIDKCESKENACVKMVTHVKHLEKGPSLNRWTTYTMISRFCGQVPEHRTGCETMRGLNSMLTLCYCWQDNCNRAGKIANLSFSLCMFCVVLCSAVRNFLCYMSR